MVPVLYTDNDGFVIPSLEIGEKVPAEPDAPDLETSTAASQKVSYAIPLSIASMPKWIDVVAESILVFMFYIRPK